MRALLAVPAAAAGLLLAAPAAHASCAAALDWHGSSYVGHGGKDRPHLGATLHDRATRPVCDDTPTTPPDAADRVPSEVEVHRFRGIPAALAIHADSGGVYVNSSTFVNLRSHPLHAMLGSNRRARTDGEPCTIKGVADVQLHGVNVAGRAVAVAVNTKVDLQRFGTGYVPDGTTIRVTGSCRDNWIDAKRIARA
jgi:hypothetical protein